MFVDNVRWSVVSLSLSIITTNLLEFGLFVIVGVVVVAVGSARWYSLSQHDDDDGRLCSVRRRQH